MKIRLPSQFKSASTKETNAFYEEGNKIIKNNGYQSDLGINVAQRFTAEMPAFQVFQKLLT